jgi:hypothetical protein
MPFVLFLVAAICFAIPSVLPSVQYPRQTHRTESANNLRQMALAMNAYRLTYDNHFPPAAGGRGVHPRLSWRVTILPFVEEENLYSQFHLDEPWDGPHNVELLPRMPKLYVLPGMSDGPGLTHYRVFVGPNAAFDKPEPDAKDARGRQWADFPSGAGKAIFVVEAAEAVPWTKPDELEYDPTRPIRPLLYHPNYFDAAMGDAQVTTIRPETPEPELLKMIERGQKKQASVLPR